MSYTYLQEQGEVSSAGCFSDIPQSVLLRLNLTAEKSYSNDKETGFCQSFQSGMMSAPSTELRGEEKSMSSAGVFPVKTSQQQEKELVSQENEADFGEKWPESLAKYDPNTHSWRTHQCLLFGEGQESLATLPNWGMTLNGGLYPRPIAEQIISAREFGFSPDGITTFHTPCTTGLDGGSNSRRALKKKAEKFPTPDANIGKRGTQQEWTAKRKSGHSAQYTLNQAVRDSIQQTGKLNPVWVEWLMGWPLGWTDLKPLEMDKFQSWLQQHGEFLEENK